MATRTDTQSPALHVVDSHDLIRLQGARENNLKDVSVEGLRARRATLIDAIRAAFPGLIETRLVRGSP